MNKGLIALAMGTFALGISEFLMMAILSHIAAAMDISVSRAGLFITAYASGVCCGAPALLFARKIPLKRLMLILSALIAAGNLLAAIAPGFITFFIARFIFGLLHGGQRGKRPVSHGCRYDSSHSSGSAVGHLYKQHGFMARGFHHSFCCRNLYVPRHTCMGAESSRA